MSLLQVHPGEPYNKQEERPVDKYFDARGPTDVQGPFHSSMLSIVDCQYVLLPEPVPGGYFPVIGRGYLQYCEAGFSRFPYS